VRKTLVINQRPGPINRYKPFEVFESTVDEAPFIVRVSKHVRLELWEMISEVKLVVYQKDGSREDTSGQVKHSNPGKRELELDLGMGVFDFDVDKSSDLSLPGFLSVTLKQLKNEADPKGKRRTEEPAPRSALGT
jgi:hypothetical protein